MIHFHSQTYTAEVLRVQTGMQRVLEEIAAILRDPSEMQLDSESADDPIRVLHGFYSSKHQHHRVTRTVVDDDGDQIEIPQTTGSGARTRYLYDVLVAQHADHVLVAVPFHGLAEEVFPHLDSMLTGRRIMYEQVDINSMVVHMGAAGTLTMSESDTGRELKLWVSRCQLRYTDPERRHDIRSVSLTGDDLGRSPVYEFLMRPVLDKEAARWTVLPVLLGFGLSINDVRKASATTDQHGNVKIHVSPSLRSVGRVFLLLQALETLGKGIISATRNVPILQAEAIRGVE